MFLTHSSYSSCVFLCLYSKWHSLPVQMLSLPEVSRLKHRPAHLLSSTPMYVVSQRSLIICYWCVLICVCAWGRMLKSKRDMLWMLCMCVYVCGCVCVMELACFYIQIGGTLRPCQEQLVSEEWRSDTSYLCVWKRMTMASDTFKCGWANTQSCDEALCCVSQLQTNLEGLFYYMSRWTNSAFLVWI